MCAVPMCCVLCRSGSSTCVPMQIILGIARVLSDLHAAGFVHRNVDPRHCMWLPQEHRWTLGGLSSVARIGEVKPLPDSLSAGSRQKLVSVPVYAAPEVVRAELRGAASMRATHALDAWALGVIVIELLAGQSVFNRSLGRAAVRVSTCCNPRLRQTAPHACSRSLCDPCLHACGTVS